jgi:excisionase family DNA binding protein
VVFVEREQELLGDGCFTIEEAVRFSGLGRSFLYEQMKAGRLPYVKVGAARRVPRRALQRFLAEHLVVGRQARTERRA